MRIAVTGACLLLAGAVWLVALVVTGIDYDWSEEARAAPDGQPHVVEVDAGRDAMVWRYQAEVPYDCEIRDGDAVSGKPGGVLEQRAASGRHRRDGGSAGDWVGTHTVRPERSVVTVTCPAVPAVADHSFVAVEPAPRLPWFLFSGTASPAGPFTLVGLGALAMLAAGLRWLTRR